MTTEEFKTQLFNTPQQWGSGISYRLKMLKEGGVTLYSVPTFIRWLQKVDGVKNFDGLGVDECRQLYFIDADLCQLYRYDPGTQRVENMHCLSGCGSNPGEVLNPAKIEMDKRTLWIVDKGDEEVNGRVQAFSREHFQIKYIIEDLQRPIDIALDGEGTLYILDSKSKQINVYENSGRKTGVSFGQEQLRTPVGLAIGKDNILYVIDKGYRGFLRFSTKGEFKGVVGNFNKVSEALQFSHIAIDNNGNLFTAAEDSGSIYQFDPDGSYVGVIQIPEATSVSGIVVDHAGNLYVGTDRGIAFLTIQNEYTKEQGIYYSKSLDSGIEACQWHRVALEAELPQKSVFQLYFYASDDLRLKNEIDQIISDPDITTQEKVKILDDKIPASSWVGPEKNPDDMLFRGKRGRYLWLKLVLSTFDDTVAPSITQMKLFYPRISYLRYLPAIYQEDPYSKEFLERFLSLFESVFYDLETDITHVFKYFDPKTVPRAFLSWLSSWLNMALEEEWPEETKRRFIEQASLLYKLKGTPEGIRKLIELYIAKRPVIMEYTSMIKPMVLRKDGQFRLGIDSLLLQTPVRGFRLGDDSILGRVALRDKVQSPEDPFLPLAHRFMVILDLTPEESKKYEKGIRRILNDEKPAHTLYMLRITKGGAGVGIWSYVGVNTRVDDYRPMQIGENAVLGTNLIAFDSDKKGGKVERRSRLGSDTFLR